VILLIVLLVLVVICGGLCAGCVVIGRNVTMNAQQAAGEFLTYLQLMPAYAATQQAVNSDPQVIDRLGEPIEALAMPERQNTGDLKPAGETFQFDIEGPKGTGIVSAIATADGGPWRVVKITVTFADGSVVDVPVPEDQPPGGEFKIEGGGNIRLEPDLNEEIQAK
jgi:hypothetical protein